MNDAEEEGPRAITWAELQAQVKVYQKTWRGRLRIKWSRIKHETSMFRWRYWWRLRHLKWRIPGDPDEELVHAVYQVLRGHVRSFAAGHYNAVHNEMDKAIWLCIKAPINEDDPMEAMYTRRAAPREKDRYLAVEWLHEVADILPWLWD